MHLQAAAAPASHRLRSGRVSNSLGSPGRLRMLMAAILDPADRVMDRQQSAGTARFERASQAAGSRRDTRHQAARSVDGWRQRWKAYSQDENQGYELRERIGAGGFGAVYRGFNPLSGGSRDQDHLAWLHEHPSSFADSKQKPSWSRGWSTSHRPPMYYWRDRKARSWSCAACGSGSLYRPSSEVRSTLKRRPSCSTKSARPHACAQQQHHPS
jgi:hypothetical protein